MSIYVSLPELVAWDYQGSHVLPKRAHPHTSTVDLAYIPSHLSKRQSWLRLGVQTDADGVSQMATVLLDRKAAQMLRNQLSDWLVGDGEWE